MSKTHDLVLRNAQAEQKGVDLALINTLPPGSLVKLRAADDTGMSEPIWLRLTDKGGEVWTGEVAASPVFLKVALRDRVRFSPVNVFDFEYPDSPNPT